MSQEGERARAVRDALEILRTSSALVRSGQTAFYKVIAVELRLLLCDTTRRHGRIVDISLLPQLLPDLRLPALPRRLAGRDSAAELPLEQWLEQEVRTSGGDPVTLRRLVRLVCDQDGGAHYDPRAASPLKELEDVPELLAEMADVLVARLAPPGSS